MPSIKNIVLTQFKNYPAAAFRFDQRIVGICGLNGKGKTNLLDAIHYLCFTKSYFSKTDALNVQMGMDGFRVEGTFYDELAKEEHKVACIYRTASKKEFSMDDSLYEKFSAHIGKFPCVVIAPDDVEMITGNSEERRKFIDTVISQMNPGYLQHLIVYNKVLLQRNSLLKSFAEQQRSDNALLDVLDEQLARPGQEIHRMRKDFCQQFIPLVKEFYTSIAGKLGAPALAYESQLNDDTFSNLLSRYREKDLLLQRSNAGPHKDDIGIQLSSRNFKNIASQGQRKSLLFAMKLAEFFVLTNAKGFSPLLLLDDVFEKLDEQRMHNLLQWVCVNNPGQVFITDTHKERLTGALNKFSSEVQVIELD